MAQRRDVVAVDIQEYSRVLCSALLSPPSRRAPILSRSARSSALYQALMTAIAPLTEYEATCVQRASRGDLEPLCDFIEYGSLSLFAQSEGSGALRGLRAALRAATAALSEAGLTASPGSMITRQFGGAYFSFAQAAALDALLHLAHLAPANRRDAAIAPILSSASEIVNTVGKHFAQPIRPRDGAGRPKKRLVARVIKDRQLDVFAIHDAFTERYGAVATNGGHHTAVKEDYEAFLRSFSGPVGVFYADPPYTRDHYSRFYHVLETMCFRDEPEISQSIARGKRVRGISRGLYRSDRHQSPFCIKSQVEPAFERLFSGVRRFAVPLVLSYSPFERATGARPRLMNIDGIVALARKHFRNVNVESAGRFAHSKLNLQDRNAPVNEHAEVLIVCRP
jgi:hypothetical protein